MQCSRDDRKNQIYFAYTFVTRSVKDHFTACSELLDSMKDRRGPVTMLHSFFHCEQQ